MGRPTAAVMIIIDGLSDISSQTALSTAHIPNLDAAAARGRVGLIDPVRPGLACGSDTAHLAIFGYDPTTCYRGRGAFEAMGAGVEILPGDIAFKCNFAIVDDATGIVTTRCAGQGSGMNSLGKLLAKRLDGISVPGFAGVQVHVHHAGYHRCVVRIRGGPLSDRVTNTDPLLDNRRLLSSRPIDIGNPAAVRTAKILNQLSDAFREALVDFSGNCIPGIKRNPVTNVLLLRGASERIQIEPFRDLHGIRAFLIAPCKIIAGVGITAGIDMVKAPGATAGYDTDLLSKARACVEYIMLPSDDDRDEGEYEYSLGIVHIKAVDEAGHEQNAKKKAYWIEQVDLMMAEISQLLVQRGRRDVVLIVTGDHTSPVVCGDHTCEPVPIVITDIAEPKSNGFVKHGACIKSDSSTCFEEVSAGTKGSLGRFPALEIMCVVKSLLRPAA